MVRRFHDLLSSTADLARNVRRLQIMIRVPAGNGLNLSDNPSVVNDRMAALGHGLGFGCSEVVRNWHLPGGYYGENLTSWSRPSCRNLWSRCSSLTTLVVSFLDRFPIFILHATPALKKLELVDIWLQMKLRWRVGGKLCHLVWRHWRLLGIPPDSGSESKSIGVIVFCPTRCTQPPNDLNDWILAGILRWSLSIGVP
jgi:hypothetical protein